MSQHLLCAVPQLQDPNFKRSVILMLEHGEEGALGLVLNNPMPTRIAEVAQALELVWRGDPEQAVRLGGPVEPTRGWFVHDQAEWDPLAQEMAPQLNVTTSLDPVREAGNHEFGGAGGRFLFLLGYAGWSGGQLEAEIGAGSWVVVPVRGAADEQRAGVDADFIFDEQPDNMWSAALHSIGVDPNRLVGLQGGAMH